MRKIRLPPLQAMLAFEATSRTQSVRAAAQELHVTHSAISHQLKLLQESLGVELLERDGRGIRLTPPGRKFAARLGDIVDQLMLAVNEVRHDAGEPRVRLALATCFASKWLVPRLPRFMQAHPEIAVSMDASLAFVDLHTGEFDLAIRCGTGKWPRTTAQRLTEETIVAVCSPQFSGGKLPRTPAEVLGLPLLCDESVFSWRDWSQAAGLSAHESAPAISFNDGGLLIQAALEGQGVALISSLLVQDDIAAGLLVQLPGPVVLAPSSYYLVTVKDTPLSQSAQVFADWLRFEVSR